MTSQSGSELPWIRWKGLDASRRPMAQEGSLLGRWRAHLIVLALLEPYFKPAEAGLHRWWRALCLSPDGRRVCSLHTGVHLGWQLHEMFFFNTYKNCSLHATVAPPPEGYRQAHPACQCCTTPQAQPGCVLLARGGGSTDDHSLTVCGTRSDVLVPWWVSKTLYRHTEMQYSSKLQDPFVCLPR